MIQVDPLTPVIGAEISGADLTALDENQFQQIWQAFIEHGVIFFRDQPALSPEQHMEVAQRFGPIHVHPAARGRDVPYPGLMKMVTTAETRVAAGNRWHSDVSCDDEPPQATLLQLHEIPAVGGDTLFASMYAAYDALSERMKIYLDGLTALHSGEESFRKLFKFKPGEAHQGWPENHHPIVRKHADSGRPALFVDREFTESIDDLPKEEGIALLNFLFDHAERPTFQCRFRWSTNAIAIWDNRCVQHHAMWDYWPQERRGHRVTVRGEKPMMWQLGEDKSSKEGPVVKLSA